MSKANEKNWRSMRQLKSVDLVKQGFEKIHGRTLNTTRAKQIVASFQQAEEYFENASGADLSVKPLLLFYGVSSLSRCLTLMLSANGGEETLPPSHGLSCEGWSEQLGTDVRQGLKCLDRVMVGSCRGLFSSFLAATENQSCLHITSSKVDWSCKYGQPGVGSTISFADVVSRIPDLAVYFRMWKDCDALTVRVQQIKGTKENAEIKVPEQENLESILAYAQDRITISENGRCRDLIIPTADFPLLMNSFINQSFGSIPDLYMTTPTHGQKTYSQISLTFMLSYFLGMLCRYHPSHWMALSRDGVSDKAWPLIESAIEYVEYAFPQLVAELLEQRMESPKSATHSTTE